MLRTPLGPRWHSTIGEARAIWHRARSLVIADMLVVLGAIGLVAGLIDITSQWTAEHQTSVRIDLSPWTLPQ